MMDPDFVREMLVLGFFLVLYIVIAALLLRKHKTDLSLVHATAGGSAGAAAVVPRLNRRRKAMQREQGQSAAGSESGGDAQG